MNPPKAEHLPFYITAPGGTDYLFVAVTIAFIAIIMLVGVLYLRLHHLPDHIASRGQKVQLELVGVLGLIAMFTHNNVFWIAALLLALITVPDISAPLASIARSLAKIAARRPATTPASVQITQTEQPLPRETGRA
ncbi:MULTISPECIES: hypothetical protein [Sinorhizobium/Ensifer group]|uniref:Uncharacterized protein n=1 Tax=Ensifer adhaerens TaxID=106592 RepID=A0A9Q8YIA6_ENSAD|nr:MULTISPECIES: hypothetical protein [Sinorhizobium/Ensifer group]KSV94836.1 hypothetical protein N184_36155 [Sinorhizobium sp. GL28]USJ28647.1 hypothetical protein NE863_35915 [Ensifer adhaerens]